jgi:hypothetical protein
MEKLSKRLSFDRQYLRISKLSYPVVVHTENCAVRSESPTVSPLYLPTPRCHHLKALRFYQSIQQMNITRYIPFQIPLLTAHFTLSFLVSDNIMADVASKQQVCKAI